MQLHARHAEGHTSFFPSQSNTGRKETKQKDSLALLEAVFSLLVTLFSWEHLALIQNTYLHFLHDNEANMYLFTLQ
jgi:hypothetical protein